MYVLCAGMYRACSTWQYEVIAHLLDRSGSSDRLGYLTGEEFAEHYRLNRQRGGWSVLKSHEGDRSFTRAIANQDAKVVYAHRDIRDVVFSLMHKRGISFEEILRQGMIHQILVNDRFWKRQPGVLVQRYEDLVSNPVQGIIELAKHLEVEITREEAEEIANEYSFQTNRQRTQELVARLKEQGVDLSDPSNLQYYDQKTLLHWNHLREGRPGNWRTQATPQQRSILSRLCDQWLAAHDYPLETQEPDQPLPSWSERLSERTSLSKAWLACALRCLSLNHPKCARAVKRMLGITTKAKGATPASVHPKHRVDAGSTIAASASGGKTQGQHGLPASSEEAFVR